MLSHAHPSLRAFSSPWAFLDRTTQGSGRDGLHLRKNISNLSTEAATSLSPRIQARATVLLHYLHYRICLWR